MYSLNTLQTSSGDEVREAVLEHADECKLDLFLVFYHELYVGKNMVDSTATLVKNICKNIYYLKQVYTDGRKLFNDPPDVLFGKFVELTSGLPDDTTL